MTVQLITMQELLEILRLKSPTSVYTLQKKDKTFPRPLTAGLRAKRYRLDEVLSWLESRKVERREVA